MLSTALRNLVCIGCWFAWNSSVDFNLIATVSVSAFVLPNNAWVHRSTSTSTSTSTSCSRRLNNNALHMSAAQRRKPRGPPKRVDGRTFQLQKELQRISRNPHTKAAQQAETYLENSLQRYLGCYEATAKSEIGVPPPMRNVTKPDEVCFNICIMAYAQQSRRDAAAPQRAEALLRRMQELQKQGHDRLKPTVFTYNAVMEAFSKSKLKRAQHSVLRLFSEMQQDDTLQVNTYTHNLLLGVYAKSMESDSYRHAQQLVARMEQLSTEGEKRVCPDRNTYSRLLQAYARHGQAEMAEELVHSLWQRFRDGEAHLKPNQVWVNNVINAWVKSGSPKSGERVDSLLRDMQSVHELGTSVIRPDTTTYNQVMNAHATVGNTTRVMELLEELEQRFAETGELDLEPDTFTYSTAIKAFANSPQHDRKSAEQASDLLQRMEDLYVAGRDKMKPNLVTYNTVLRIWARSGNREGLQRATNILRGMQEKAAAGGDERIQPDSFSYAELIHGWSRSGLRDAGHKSEQLLYELQELPPLRQRGVQVTTLYNSVIKSWAKSGDKAAPRHADSLLALLEQKFYNGDSRACPDSTTFLCISDAYAKSNLKDAQVRIEGLLLRMEKLMQAGATGLKPNRSLYNSILNALAKSGQKGAAKKAEELLLFMQNRDDDDLRPDVVTYATVIDCHTKSGEPADRAEELLRFVEESYENGDTLLKPNPVFYSAVFQALAKSATTGAAERAEQLLRRNEELYKNGYDYAKPHAIVYNAVIDAIARSGGSGEKAEALLAEMEELYEAGSTCMKPSRRTINAVMLAYRHEAGGSLKAEKLLRRMEELAEDGVYSDISPGTVAYNCVIGAITDSEDSNAAERTQALLDRMIELYGAGNWGTRPDEITYSCVIEAWLKRNDEQGSEMAHQLLQEFLDMVEVTKIRGESLGTDAVWDVINTYKRDDGEISSSGSVESVFKEMTTEFDGIEW